MLGWFVRGLLVASGLIASWFVSREAHNFEVVQMVVAMFLFVLLAAVAAFWPSLTGWLKRRKNGEV